MQVWLLQGTESLLSLQAEFASQTSIEVSVEYFGNLLSGSNRPIGFNSSEKVVTICDSNPRILRLRCWEDLFFDFTPVKLDGLYWLPTAKLLKVTSTGLEVEEVGNRTFLRVSC
jgi:hypothetical protein